MKLIPEVKFSWPKLLASISGIILLVIFSIYETKYLKAETFLSGIIQYITSLPSELLAAWMGIIGVLVGVFFSNRFAIISERKKNKRQLVYDFVELEHKSLLYFKKWKSKHSNEKEKADQLAIDFLILKKELNLHNLKCWEMFNDILIKAKSNVLTHSIYLFNKELCSSPPPNSDEYNIGYNWIEHLFVEMHELLMDKTKIPYKTPKGVVFVGWRKVNAIDKSNLKMEAMEVPWRPHIKFDFEIQPKTELATKLHELYFKKIRNLKCKEHGYAAHIIFSGRSIDQKIEIVYKVCCPEFQKITERCLVSQ